MNSNYTEILIRELITDLKSKYLDFKGIYFFGSRIAKKYSEESDLDLPFTFGRNINRKFKDEIRSLVYDYDLKYDIVIDSHIYNYRDILNPITPFRNNVKTLGIFYGV